MWRKRTIQQRPPYVIIACNLRYICHTHDNDMSHVPWGDCMNLKDHKTHLHSFNMTISLRPSIALDNPKTHMWLFLLECKCFALSQILRVFLNSNIFSLSYIFCLSSDYSSISPPTAHKIVLKLNTMHNVKLMDSKSRMGVVSRRACGQQCWKAV